MFITDRGRPAFALLKIQDYYKLASQHESSLLDAVDAIPGDAGVELEAPPLQARFGAAELG